MDKFMSWMTDRFAPRVNKIAKNPWVASVQSAILTAMPMVFIGSFATILSIVKDYWKGFPDFSLLSTFSFGLFSLFLAYLIPEAVMNNKGHKEVSKQAGLAGLAFFLILVYPTITAEGQIRFDLNSFGTAGMIAALIAGLFVGIVMNLFSKWKIIGEDSAIPDFVATWFNTLIPITLILLVGWVFTFELHINLYHVINSIFLPLINLGQGFWGFVLVFFLGFAFLYTFGISSWVLYPVQIAIALPAIAQNQANFEAGKAVTNIFTNEAAAIFLIGGGGATFALCIMLAFMAKSQRLRMIGKASLIPSIFNINEPIVFGAPIAFNPILMVPMWIIGLVGPILTWIVMKIGLVPIPHKPFQLWYTPGPIQSWIVTESIRGLIFFIILFAISWIIYYPFFKIYDKQAVQQDLELAEEGE
ncbi:Lichenan permease IIC component [Neobacillus rhizosphaerae]|uniref:Permease IIC component n=1 Tax=Neobacillus rhizosphaerae TaxID=2880965 RepID=A0ABM9EX89_9BACI|nr:PTS transporter subunit EIIC [Neobacillus rhizosphaerae]CAH2716786.1 Lichenan permease IIC component [Neobacillus rhizosphaerae]